MCKEFLVAFILAVIVLSVVEGQIHINFTWPDRDRAAVVDGDIYLGVLHNVHDRSAHQSIICGPIMSHGGIQALEVVLYTLDHINNNPNLLPGITLGVLAKDGCHDVTFGAQQTLSILPGSKSDVFEYTCQDGSKPNVRKTVISGIVDATTSYSSMQLANLCSLFAVPQISSFSTSPRLSSEMYYPYFLRTIPSDIYRARAMVELVQMFNWTYVSVVYEDSSYGYQGFEEVNRLLREHQICIATVARIQKHSGEPDMTSYDSVVEVIKTWRNARGVLVFASAKEIGELMKAVRRRNATGWFSWIGNEGWGATSRAFFGYESEIEGALTVQQLANEVQGFEEYFLNLKPDTNTRNPWFTEFWEQLFNCKYPGSRRTPYNGNFNQICSGDEIIGDASFEFDQRLKFVSDAVMVFAYALDNIRKDHCGENGRICEIMNPVDGDMLMRYLERVTFTGLSGQEFSFLSNGDAPPRYRILNFQQVGQGQYQWKTVGLYENDHLNNMLNVKYRWDEPNHPNSVCSQPCQEGEKKVSMDDCCWLCVRAD